MSAIDVAIQLSALGAGGVNNAISGIAGTVTRTGETISGAMSRAKDATSGLIDRVSQAQKGIGDLGSTSKAIENVGKTLDSSAESAGGLVKSINDVKAAQGGIDGSGFKAIVTSADEADEAVKRLRADMAKSNPFTNPATAPAPGSSPVSGGGAGGIIPTVSKIQVAQDDDPAVAAFRAKMAQSNPFVNAGTGQPVAPATTPPDDTAAGAGGAGGPAAVVADTQDKTLKLMSLHMVAGTFNQWGRSAQGFADNMAEVSLQAGNTKARLEALLTQQGRAGDISQVEGNIQDISARGHVANPNEVRNAAIQMASDEVKTSDLPQLMEAATRNAQTMNKSLDEIGVSFAKAYAEGSLTRLKRANILFTDQEQAAVQTAFGISKAAGQTEFMRVVMEATNRDTAKLGEGLTEAQARANDASRSFIEMSESMGKGAENAKTGIAQISLHLLSLVTASPKVAEAAGMGLEWGGHILSSIGGLIMLGAQLSMIKNAFPALGTTSVVNFAKMRLAGVQAFLAIDIAGAPLWAVIALIAVAIGATIVAFKGTHDAGTMAADDLVAHWGVLGELWDSLGEKLGALESKFHPFANHAADVANREAYDLQVKSDKKHGKTSMTWEQFQKQQEDGPLRENGNGAAKTPLEISLEAKNQQDTSTSSPGAVPTMADIQSQMAQLKATALSGAGTGTAATETSAEGEAALPSMPSSGGIIGTMSDNDTKPQDYRSLQERAAEGDKSARPALRLANLHKRWAKEDEAAARKAEREHDKSQHAADIEAGISQLGDGSGDVKNVTSLRDQLRELRRKKDDLSKVKAAILQERIARAEDAVKEEHQVNSAEKVADRAEKADRLWQLKLAHEAEVDALRNTITKANRKQVTEQIHELNRKYEMQSHAIREGGTATGATGLIGIANAVTGAKAPTAQEVAEKAFEDAQAEVAKADEEFSKAKLEAAKLMERAVRAKYADARKALIQTAEAMLDKAQEAKDSAENKLGWAKSDKERAKYNTEPVGLSNQAVQPYVNDHGKFVPGVFGEGYSREARARQEAWARGDMKGAGIIQASDGMQGLVGAGGVGYSGPSSHTVGLAADGSSSPEKAAQAAQANFDTTVESTPDEFIISFNANPVRIKKSATPQRAITSRNVGGATR